MLPLASDGSTRYMVLDGDYSTVQDIRLKLRLPTGVTCAACVLQWKYNAGNSWGVDPVTKQGCIGCGPQEQFYGCADVAIGHDETVTGVAPEKFPWYFQEPDSEWHYGIAYVFGTGGDRGAISGASGREGGGGGLVGRALVVLLGAAAAVLVAVRGGA